MLNETCEFIMSRNLPAVEKFLLVLLLRNGLRVSEICTPSYIRVINSYKALVYCSKNKVWRSCVTGEASELLNDTLVTDMLPHWRRNRQYYYRLLKGHFVNVETQREGNDAVTHAARYISAQQAFDATEDMQAVQTSVGNKTSSASEHYISRKQKKALQQGNINVSPSGTLEPVNVTKRGVVRTAIKCNHFYH